MFFILFWSTVLKHAILWMKLLIQGGNKMPIINVKLLEGRSDEQLKNLVTEVTNAVEKLLELIEAIHVIIEEMQKITMALQELENQTQNKTLISLHNNIMVFIKVVKECTQSSALFLRFSYLEIL